MKTQLNECLTLLSVLFHNSFKKTTEKEHEKRIEYGKI